jgi:sulfur-carrier protein
MQVTVKYFAALREALGPQEMVEVPSGATVGILRDLLISKGHAHLVLNRHFCVRMALNYAVCKEDAVLEEGAEVAFFPPVTGG